MNQYPKVSVIIMCYNQKEFIREAIESVLNQTYKDYELIVGDNGSTDGSWEVITSYKEKIICWHREQNNMVACGKELMSFTKGEYFAWLCGDDYWYPEKLEEQMKAVEEHQECNIFFTYAEKVNKTLEQINDREILAKPNRSSAQWLKTMFCYGTSFDASTMLVKNDGRIWKYWSGAGKFRQLPDFYQYLKMILEEEIYIIEKFLVKHRDHGANLSHISEDTRKRTMNEENYLKHLIIEKISNEDFVEGFGEYFDKDVDLENKADITCQKILYYLNAAKEAPWLMPGALDFFWDHYEEEGVAELLANKYGVEMDTIYDYEKNYGIGAAMMGKRWILWGAKELLSVKECNQKVRELSNIKEIQGELLNIAGEALGVLLQIVLENSGQEAFFKCYQQYLVLKENGMNDGEWHDFVEMLGNVNNLIE